MVRVPAPRACAGESVARSAVGVVRVHELYFYPHTPNPLSDTPRVWVGSGGRYWVWTFRLQTRSKFLA